MGNVPAKEERRSRRSSSITSISNLHLANSALAHTLKGAKGSAGGAGSHSGSKRQSTKERQLLKEKQAKGLIVKFDENVDGGFLAPYGIYNLNLDYNVDIVKSLIIKRKLAPFYTPLQDFNDTWTDFELLKIVDSLTLHSLDLSGGVDDEVDDDFEYFDDEDLSNLSKKELKRYQNRKFNKELKDKKIEWQLMEEERFRNAKQNKDSNQLFSDDLKLLLYKNMIECPICFLYFPKWLNYSRCCVQPICTECFVQIKRLPPHFPHDHEDENAASGNNPDPNDLISEYAMCPYCATPNFGITYQHPSGFKTGINGEPPSSFQFISKLEDQQPTVILEDEELKEFDIQDNYFKPDKSARKRRGSLPPNNPDVLTTDFIRPDWEAELQAARSKLQKKNATASAIHTSNLLLGNDTSAGNASTSNDTSQLEQQMIEQALRLSLIDEENRKKSKK